MQVNISEATIDQLREFATVHQGLDLPKTANRAVVISQLRAAGFEADMIEVTETAAISKAKRAGTDGDGLKSGFSKVIINEGNEEDGDQPVFLGCQGVGIRVPRGKEVVIANKYVEVLKNAKRDRRNEHGDKIGEIHSYSFSVLETAA